MLGGIFEKNKIKEKIHTFNKKIVQENFWKEKSSAQKILKEKKFLENIFDEFNSTVNELENLQELLALALKENDTLVVKDCEKKINLLFNQIKKIEVRNIVLTDIFLHFIDNILGITRRPFSRPHKRRGTESAFVWASPRGHNGHASTHVNAVVEGMIDI